MSLDQPVNIRSTVIRAANTFLALATTKRLAYHVVVDDALPERVLMDGTRLSQVLGNLIGACQAGVPRRVAHAPGVGVGAGAHGRTSGSGC